MIRRIGALSGMLVLTACGAEERGRFDLTLSWAEGPPAPGSVFLSARVEERDAPEVPGRVLAAVPARPYEPGMRFELLSVPNGEDRVAIVEGRPDATDTLLPIYYGRSAPFRLAPGLNVTVEIDVALRRPPQIDERLHGIEILSVGSSTASDGLLRVNQPTVALGIRAPVEARLIQLSNRSDFSQAQVQPLGEPIECEGPVCAYRVDAWSLNEGLDDPCVNSDFCPRQVFARLLDSSGYGSTELSQAVVLDTRAPEIAVAAAAFIPGEAALLAQPDAARPGTTIAVSITASEALPADAFPTAWNAVAMGSTLQFTLVPESRSELGGIYEAVVGNDDTEGLYIPQLELVDLAGNRTDRASFTDPALRVLKTTPRLEVRQEQVSYVRTPFGSERGTPELEIRAGPRFELAPLDESSSASTLEADTFTLLDRPGPRLLRVWADADKEVLLGQGAPQTADGPWPRSALRLRDVDAPRVYVTGVDGAGNESEAVAIEHIWCKATSNPGPVRNSPQAVLGTDFVQDTQEQVVSDPEIEGVASLDGSGAIRRSTTRWIPLTAYVSPELIAFEAAAFDANRGRLLIFGGRQLVGNGDRLSDHWEWDGNTWSRVNPAVRPGPRGAAEAAFDSWRGETVLFGGIDERDNLLDEGWAYDGLTWRRLPRGPSARFGSAMAFHGARGEVILHGGETADGYSSETWRWDGRAWTPVPGAGPPGRQGAAMTYDSRRDRIILFGGSTEIDVLFNDTWEFDGDVWTQRHAGGPTAPPALRSGAMAYSPHDEQTILTGGIAAGIQDETWAWNGTDWTMVDQNEASPTLFATEAFFDPLRRQVVTHNGGTFGAWTGSEWRDVGPPQTTGPPFVGQGTAYDPGSGQVVAYGGAISAEEGASDSTIYFDGTDWFDANPDSGPRPPARWLIQMAYDERAGNTFMYGGNVFPAVATLADGWTFNDRTWSLVWPDDNIGGPGPRNDAEMVFHRGLDRVLLGGDGPGSELDLWAWDGINLTWTELATDASVRPPALRNPAMAYDSSRDMLVVFGGGDDLAVNFETNDVWEWDGTDWRLANPSSGPRPAPRIEARMVYEPRLGEVLMYGGRTEDITDDDFTDIWSWNGGRWRLLSPTQGPSPSDTSFLFELVYMQSRAYAFTMGGLLNDRWGFDFSPNAQPALTFVAQLPEYPPENVLALRVRAYCAGRYAPYDAGAVGAELFVWSTGGPGLPAGGWTSVGFNQAGIADTDPQLGSFAETELSWESFDPVTARAFVFDAKRRSFVQCRPRGVAGRGQSEVALDFAEVRTLYRLP